MQGYNFKTKTAFNALDSVEFIQFRGGRNCQIAMLFNERIKPTLRQIDGLWVTLFPIAEIGSVFIEPHKYLPNQGNIRIGTFKATYWITNDVLELSTTY